MEVSAAESQSVLDVIDAAANAFPRITGSAVPRVRGTLLRSPTRAYTFAYESSHLKYRPRRLLAAFAPSPEMDQSPPLEVARVEESRSVADETIASRVRQLDLSQYQPLPVPDPMSYSTEEDAAVVQTFEGTVLDVDQEQDLMHVSLHAKLGDLADHVADIELESVLPQDRDLVRPGAVFYLTLYKRRKSGGTIVNAEDLRFRRRPAWSQEGVAAINAAAEKIMAKLKPKSIVE